MNQLLNLRRQSVRESREVLGVAIPISFIYRRNIFTLTTVMVGIGVVLAGFPWAIPARGAGGELELQVTDRDTGEPVAVRMHLRNQRGKSVRPRGTVSWSDHFVFDGRVVLKLPPGQYTFEIDRGPEYRLRTGHFLIRQGAADNKQVDMQRFVDMASNDWWSGELHIHRTPNQIELHMLAEDLHVAPVITWWNDRNFWSDRQLPTEPLKRFADHRFYHLMAGEDERAGGAVMFFNLARPLPIAGSEREFPASVYFLKKAKELGAHIDLEKPFWWDFPAWIATGMVDSVGLANNHIWRNGMLDNEAWGKPRDRVLFPPPHGNARWSQEIYYRLLNCGHRIPPSAGSASGVLSNPVGYNRVYVHCEAPLTYGAWWEGLRQGRVVVTNGPLLRPRVNGQLPGHVFFGETDQEVSLDIALNLSARDKISYLEIVKNGRTVQQVRLDEWKSGGGKLPQVKFTESGWMLIRAVTDNEETFRFASTGPYYVEIGGQPRISKKSAQFFLDWTRQRARQLKLEDAKKQEQAVYPHQVAEGYWQSLLARANAR